MSNSRALFSILLGWLAVSSVSAELVAFKIFADNRGNEVEYKTHGLLVDKAGICVLGLPNDYTVKKIKYLEGADKMSSAKLISYDSYARYAFVRVKSKSLSDFKPTLFAEEFPVKRVKKVGAENQFLVVGEVATHNRKVIPFSFYRIHQQRFKKKKTEFPFLNNEKGKVVGMLHSEVLGSNGAFYTIPASVFQKHLSDVREFGVPTRAWVGVTLDANVGLPIVKSVRPTSSAALSGFQKGDVITAISGKQVASYNEAVKAFYLLRAEQETQFVVVRGDQKLVIDLSPKKFPSTSLNVFSAHPIK